MPTSFIVLLRFFPSEAKVPQKNGLVALTFLWHASHVCIEIPGVVLQTRNFDRFVMEISFCRVRILHLELNK